MTKERIGPTANLEDIEARQRQRTKEEDEGVHYDDELDQKRLLDDTLLDHDVESMPVDRLVDRDTPEDRGSTPVDDETRGEKRRRQYEDGAEFVSETD